MSVFRNGILVSLMALFFMASSNVSATVYVPDYGSSGMQTFSYGFTSAFNGTITIGVSDAGDYQVHSLLELPDYGVSLDTEAGIDTSAYLNTLGEPGTQGDIYSFNIVASEGDILTFDWEFTTDDYHPFHDFAFIDIEGLHYEVLAQIDGTAVPVPAAVWLFGSGLLGLVGIRRRQQALS